MAEKKIKAFTLPLMALPLRIFFLQLPLDRNIFYDIFKQTYHIINNDYSFIRH